MDEERSARDGHLRLVDPQDGAEGADAADTGVQQDEHLAEVAEAPVLWRGQPSLLLAAGPCARAVLFLGVALVATHGWAPWHWGAILGTQGLLAWISDGRLWILLTLILCAHAVLEVASEGYVLTATHLRKSEGLRVRHTSEIAIRQLLSVRLEEVWPLRWLGLMNVIASFENPTAGCSYCQRPLTFQYRLRAIPARAALPQRLHQARASLG